MSEVRDNSSEPNRSQLARRLIAGGVLLVVGLLSLLTNWLGSEIPILKFLPVFNLELSPEEWLTLPALGLVFLIWGGAGRNGGLLIAGGLIGGFGSGAFLIQAPYRYLTTDARGGIFLLCTTTGLVIGALLASRFTHAKYMWAVTTAAVLALVGGIMLVSSSALENLTYIGAIWSLALVAIGCYLIFWQRKPVE